MFTRDSLSFPPARPARLLSCGTVLLGPQGELLLCHVTGLGHWDLPKGGIDAGETPLQAALRETREETGLRLDADALLDLGRHAYTPRKDLHLFAALLPRVDIAGLHCDSFFTDRRTGRRRPEMDGFGWFDLGRLPSLGTAQMAELLTVRLDLGAVRATLAAAAAPPARLAA